MKEEAYKISMITSNNKRVKHRSLNVCDLVLRKVIIATKISEHGKLVAKWKSSYVVTRVNRPSIYYLRTMDGIKLMRPWNIEYLKIYYPWRKHFVFFVMTFSKEKCMNVLLWYLIAYKIHSAKSSHKEVSLVHAQFAKHTYTLPNPLTKGKV